MEVAIWIIGLIAAIVIVVIYIITSVNKYSNSFIGKYFKDEGSENKNAESNSDEKQKDNQT
ncbi:MAG: hypothetical protein JSS91_05230 [Bacteroidetes bacterium]|nr:hypothetical protein [Bacteroidota bacterium]